MSHQLCVEGQFVKCNSFDSSGQQIRMWPQPQFNRGHGDSVLLPHVKGPDFGFSSSNLFFCFNLFFIAKESQQWSVL